MEWLALYRVTVSKPHLASLTIPEASLSVVVVRVWRTTSTLLTSSLV